MCSSADSKINEGENGRLEGVSFHFKHKAKLHCIRLAWDTTQSSYRSQKIQTGQTLRVFKLFFKNKSFFVSFSTCEMFNMH